MSIFSKAKNKLQGVDPFYEEVRTEQIGLYQYFFSRLIRSVDIDTQTKWAQGKDYSRAQMEKDEETMERIIVEEAGREGLSPAILQVMTNQYFFADELQRERERHDWIKRVLYRKDPDYLNRPGFCGGSNS